MTHEKIIKREDGREIKVEVWLWLKVWAPDKGFVYFMGLKIKQKGETEFQDYEGGLLTNVLTPEEIHQAKLELWEKLKPVEEI